MFFFISRTKLLPIYTAVLVPISCKFQPYGFKTSMKIHREFLVLTNRTQEYLKEKKNDCFSPPNNVQEYIILTHNLPWEYWGHSDFF